MKRKRDANDVIALGGRESEPALNHNLTVLNQTVECSNLTKKMKTIVTQLGEIEYIDFHFSNLSVTLFVPLGFAVVVDNGASLRSIHLEETEPEECHQLLHKKIVCNLLCKY